MAASIAEQFLAGRINYERALSMPNSEEAFKLGRMRELLLRIGDPQLAMPIIHVAGTKGKGSTAAMIAAILTAAGRRVGLFSSPHIDHITERMTVEGLPCPADEFADLVELVRPAVEVMDREGAERHPPEMGPTYFEIITAMALKHFSIQKVTAAVLEVGLGGRLDSTNVCSPCLSVITSISFDHTRQLGDTLAKIAAEKAGIIKPVVTVVSGVRTEEPREVIRRAAAKAGCRLVELGVDFDFKYHPPRNLDCAPSPAVFDFIKPRVSENDIKPRPVVAPACWGGSSTATPSLNKKPRPVVAPDCCTDGVAVELPPQHCPSAGEGPGVRAENSQSSTVATTGRGFMTAAHGYALSLLGRHQAANAAIALAAVEQLRNDGWAIPDAAVRRGLASVSWPARVEVLSRRPTVIVDAAHNVASIKALVETLDESFAAARRLLIFATTVDKDVEGMLRELLGRFDHVIFTRYSDNPRGVPPEELQRLASIIKPRTVVAPTVEEVDTKPRPVVAQTCWGGSSTAIPSSQVSPRPLGEGPGVRAEKLLNKGATAGLSSSAGEVCRKNTAGQASSGTHSQKAAIKTATTETAPTPSDAWEAIGRIARPDDLICITGSFFIAADMRRLIAERPFNP